MIGGAYRIVDRIDRRERGSLYSATDPSTGAPCAVMAFDGEVANRVAIERFAAGARVRAKVESEHILDVLDADIDAASGTPWVALEWGRGVLLETRLRGEPIPWDEATRLLEQIFHALSAAHRAGVVHGDPGPSMVLVGEGRSGST